jgi:hypothetical protein
MMMLDDPEDYASRVGVRIGKEVLKISNKEYLAYLNERGLMQEILDEI